MVKTDDILPQLCREEKIKDKYVVKSAIGQGAFGSVYKVKDLRTGEVYAMKTESTAEKTHILKVEQFVLIELKKTQSKHACRFVDRGKSDDGKFVFVIMTLVGKSLQQLRKARTGSRFSLGTAVRAGLQCMEALRDLHKIGFLHRDIKPGNFAIGRLDVKQEKTIFVLDFGLARKFTTYRGTLRTPRSGCGFRGTLRYAPLGCHRHKDLGRKDDLESWFYLLVEMTTGRLPWSSLHEQDEVGKLKDVTRENSNLYQKCPYRFKQILKYLDGLSYWDEPDYDFVGKILKRVMKVKKISDNDPYDWENDDLSASTADTSHDPPN